MNDESHSGGGGVGVDHLVYGAPDLELGVARIVELLGRRPVPGGRHAAYGTRNALLALGPACYLEVMAPDPGLPAPPRGVLFDLERLESPRLLTWAVRHPTIEPAARRAGIGPIESGRRERPDGTPLTWWLSDPYADRMGGVIPFLIDWRESPHPASSSPEAGRLVELRLEHPAPERIRSALSRLGADDLVGDVVRVYRGGAPGLAATIEGGGRIVELA